MSKPRLVFCYKVGVLGGVCSQLLNRLPHLSKEFDVYFVFSEDHGMVKILGDHQASTASSATDRTTRLREIRPDITVVIDSPEFFDPWVESGSPGKLVLEVHTTYSLAYLDEVSPDVPIELVITVSEYMRRRVSEIHTLRHSSTVAVSNCLDESWYLPTLPPIDITPPPVVWIGKLDGHKQVRLAIDVIGRVGRSRDILPIFVGGYATKEPNRIRHLLASLMSQPNLSQALWWPRVEYSTMPRFLRSVSFSSGVVLSTSVNESFGMAVAEALVMGCPVSAPRVGALPEFLPPSGLYDPGNTASAVETTTRLLDSTQEWHRVSEPHIERLQQQMKPESAAQQLVELLTKLVDA